MGKSARYDRSTHCTACGEPWNTHQGVTPTCKKLQIVRKALKEVLRGGPLTAFEKHAIAKQALEETK